MENKESGRMESPTNVESTQQIAKFQQRKIVRELINMKQITAIKSAKVIVKPIKKEKVFKQTITELLTLNNVNLTSTEDNNKVGESSIQAVINSCHPDIKTLFNHTNIERYKVTSDSLELKLNTGIRITVYPNKTINFTQRHTKNNITTTSRHTIHQTRYVIKDNKGKIILDKKG